VLRDYGGPGWTVEEVELVRSVLGRSPEHRTLAVFRLG
jgi:hypothetical protein